MGYTVGIDIGGTFTDCVAVADDGQVASVKVPSTPPRFEEGFRNALTEVAAAVGLDSVDFLQSVDHVLHGTTVATNTMVQRSGAKVGIITTRGHRDATLIMKGHGRVAGLPVSALTHPQLTDKPEPLVPRRLIKEVDERVGARGEIVVALDRDAVRRAGEELVAAGCEAIAICFLWSFRNDEHERLAKEVLEGVVPPGFPVISSAEVVPRWGEYERFMAAVISAYLAPETDRYLERVRSSLESLREEVLIIQCTGGVTPLSRAGRSAAFLIGSGPVGGMNGSEALVRHLDIKQALCTDMGGTSFDVGLIVDGRSLRTRQAVVNQFTYQVPAVDVRSIGSGGGSIIWIDPVSKTMRVGPRSAGAYPGPPCYRRGGTDPTVTDANVLIGFIDPEYFLGGHLVLDPELARKAMAPVAAALDLSVEEAAAGAIHIVENQMAELLQKMTLEQGYDPRTFTVLAYGGAASLHATAYARHLPATDVIVPRSNIASVWSAFGVASTDPGLVKESAVLLVEPFTADDVRTAMIDLRSDAAGDLGDQGWEPGLALFDVTLDVKYQGQIHVIEVPLYTDLGVADPIELDLPAILGTFEGLYARKYGSGTGFPEAGYAIDAIRLRARVPIPKPVAVAARDSAAGSGQKGEREVYWPHLRERRVVPVYDGVVVSQVSGPAILEFPFTSIVLRDGDHLTMTETGDARIRIEP